MKDTLRIGLAHSLRYTVPPGRTVPHLLPESAEFAAMPPVLATGYLVGIVEWACMEALRMHLEGNEATLGTHVDISHDAPTVPGSTVRVDVALTGFDGRVLDFEIEASDENGVISRGRHRRAVVDAVRFSDRLDRIRQGNRS